MAFFAIPARGDSGLQENLNAFLRSHRVLTVHREFVAQGDNSFWALAVEYLEGTTPSGANSARGGKPRVDYKEVLSPDDFAVFAKLREWRKATAEQDGVPVYAVLTNEQLAAIATSRPSSAAQVREVEGIGEAKGKKYAEAVLEVVKQAGGSGPPRTRALRAQFGAGTRAETDTDTDGAAGVPPDNDQEGGRGATRADSNETGR